MENVIIKDKNNKMILSGFKEIKSAGHAYIRHSVSGESLIISSYAGSFEEFTEIAEDGEILSEKAKRIIIESDAEEKPFVYVSVTGSYILDGIGKK